MKRQLTTLENVLRRLIAATNGEFRWGKMPVSTPENIAEHMIKQMWIVHICYALEEYFDNPHEISLLQLLMCAPYHDICETKMEEGDVLLLDKNHPDKKAAHNRAEITGHTRVIAEIVPTPLRAHFPLPIDHDPSATPTMKAFWEATEYLGYALFALEELRLLHENKAQNSSIAWEWKVRNWDEVLYNSRRGVRTARKQFKSIDTWWKCIAQERLKLVPKPLRVNNHAQAQEVRTWRKSL